MADCVPGKTKSNLGQQSKILCDPCEEDGLQKEASGFCVECQHYLCDHCYKYHRVPMPMRHHRLLDKNEMPKHKVKSDFSDLCHIHDGALNKYYCKTHEVTGCIACMNSDHKSCGEFSILAEITKNFEDSDLVKDFLAWTNQAEQEIDDHNDLTEDNIQTSKDSAKKAICDIENYEKAINDKFHQLKKHILKEASDMEQQDVKKITNLQQLVKSTEEELAQVKSDIEILQSTKQSKQLFIAMNKAKLQRHKLDKQLTVLKENNNVRKYTFVENELLKNMLSNIDQIGELLIQANSDEKPTSSFANYPEYGIPKGAYISGTKCVLADHIHNCLELHVVVNNITFLAFEYPLSSGPWGITPAGKKKVAVTLPNEKTIKVMSVTDSQITELTTIPVDARCEGIVYGSDNLFVTCTQPAKLLVVGMDGVIKKTLETTETGCPIFTQPAYVAVDQEEQQICVTDRQKTTITVIDTSSWNYRKYKTYHQVLCCAFADNNRIRVLDTKRNYTYTINLQSLEWLKAEPIKDTGFCKCFYFQRNQYKKKDYLIVTAYKVGDPYTDS